MKKKIAFILALVFALTAFALVGCTDKPRKLDEVEKSIVGTWNTIGTDTITFNEDGTWARSNGNKGTFSHTGDGTDATLGHYERINDGHSNFGLFDNHPDRLYYIDTDGVVQGYYTRQ